MTVVWVSKWRFCDYRLRLREDWSLVLIRRLVVMGVEEKSRGTVQLVELHALSVSEYTMSYTDRS